MNKCIFISLIIIISITGCMGPGELKPYVGEEGKSWTNGPDDDSDSVVDDLQGIVIIDSGEGIGIHLWTGDASYTGDDILKGVWGFQTGDEKPITGMAVEVTVQKGEEAPVTHKLTTDNIGFAEVVIEHPERRVEYTFTLVKVDGRPFSLNETEREGRIKFTRIIYGDEFTLTPLGSEFIYDEFTPEIEFSWIIETPPWHKQHTNQNNTFFDVEIEEPDGSIYQKLALASEGAVKLRIPFGEEDPGFVYKARIIQVWSIIETNTSDYYNYFESNTSFLYAGDGDEIRWTVPEKTVKVVEKAVTVDIDPWDSVEKPMFYWKLEYDGLPVANTRVYLNVQDVNYDGDWYSVEWSRSTDDQGNLEVFVRADTTQTKMSIKYIGDDTMQYTGDGDELYYSSED